MAAPVKIYGEHRFKPIMVKLVRDLAPALQANL